MLAATHDHSFFASCRPRTAMDLSPNAVLKQSLSYRARYRALMLKHYALDIKYSDIVCSAVKQDTVLCICRFALTNTFEQYLSHPS